MFPVTERWRLLRERIKALSEAELPATPLLIAVSKGQPAEAIEPLIKAGQKDFGENRLQEAQAKWGALKQAHPEARLHLIGPLQTNKVKQALSLFNAIHTVDRESLVDEIARCRAQGETLTSEFFVQVNTGEESQKGGVSPKSLAGLLDYCAARGLPVSGLMCIPPAKEPPAPHFALLRKLAERFVLTHLSMGMSGDYETAVRLGATHVRIGTALFGERPA